MSDLPICHQPAPVPTDEPQPNLVVQHLTGGHSAGYPIAGCPECERPEALQAYGDRLYNIATGHLEEGTTP